MEAKSLRIVYMGTPDFAVAPLRNLVEKGYNVVAVVTSVDKPAGRGLRMQESAVKRYAVEVGLPVLQPEKLKDPAFVEQFKALNADLGIVIAFRMLPEVIWAAPKLGTFNLHASLLPQYRGAAPINWAIINGEKQTGVTTFMLNHEIDKGAVLMQQAVDITDTDDVGTLHDKLMDVGTGLVERSVELVASGNVSPTAQEDMSVNGVIKDAPKIFKDTCRVNWGNDSRTIYNFVRGLSPYPAAWSELVWSGGGREPEGVKIYHTHTEPFLNENPTAGEIYSDNRSYIKVACADGWIFIDRLQVAGKRQMDTGEFLRGFKDIGGYSFR